MTLPLELRPASRRRCAKARALGDGVRRLVASRIVVTAPSTVLAPSGSLLVPSVYDFKPAFQRLLRPLSLQLVRGGVTPNGVTVAAVLLAFVGGAMLWLAPTERWPLLALPAALVVRMALNALDGMMAREHGLASPLGMFLNELGDVTADAALYLPLALQKGVSAPLQVAIVVLGALSELAGVVAVRAGAQRRYDGPMGKSDRAFAFGALGLVLGLGVERERWIAAVQALVAVLLVWTIVNRVRRALRGASLQVLPKGES